MSLIGNFDWVWLLCERDPQLTPPQKKIHIS